MFCKLNCVLLRKMPFFFFAGFSDSYTFSTSLWNTVHCLKCVTVQWFGTDSVKLVIATYPWGLDLEPLSKTWQKMLTTPGQRRNTCGASPEWLFDLGLLVEKGTREVGMKTLACFFPWSPHSRLLLALLNNELQRNYLIQIVSPLNSGNLLELALCELLVSKGVIYSAVAYGSKVPNSWVAHSTLRVCCFFFHVSVGWKNSC